MGDRNRYTKLKRFLGFTLSFYLIVWEIFITSSLSSLFYWNKNFDIFVKFLSWIITYTLNATKIFVNLFLSTE